MEEKNKKLKCIGLTPAQIKKAIYGGKKDQKDKSSTLKKPISKIKKPNKSFRVSQNHDFGMLLNMTFSSTQTASIYKTPEWFTFSQKADVSVIVPIYKNDAEKLIQSWDHKNDGLKVELIFVDDNCPINSKEAVLNNWEKKKDNLKFRIGKIYSSTITQGWSACCNIGAEKASADVLVFLHPNTILTEGWLKPIIRLLRKNEIGLVGAFQLEGDARTVSDAGSEWVWKENRFLIEGQEIYKGINLAKPFFIDNMPEDMLFACERDKISSYCMAVRKADFRYFGGFSCKINSIDWSDADICMSFKEKGFKIFCQGVSQVFREIPVKKQDRFYEQGKVYFTNKWVNSGRMRDFISTKNQESQKEIEAIVLRRGAATGDVFIAASVSPALKQKYPKAKIVFSTDCPDVLKGNPYIDKVIETHSERWFQLYYDLDMIYECRPNTHILDSFADYVGVKTDDCKTFIQTEAIDLDFSEDYAVIHAGKTFWVGRNWSTLKFDSISKKIAQAGLKIICVGTNLDHKTSYCDLNLIGKTNINQLAYVLQKAKLFIGIDSFPMLVAENFNIAGVSVFGAIKPETRLKKNSSIIPVVADGLKCLGCHHRKSTPCTLTNICEIGVQDCMNNVSVEKVWNVISSFIK